MVDSMISTQEYNEKLEKASKKIDSNAYKEYINSIFENTCIIISLIIFAILIILLIHFFFHFLDHVVFGPLTLSKYKSMFIDSAVIPLIENIKELWFKLSN